MGGLDGVDYFTVIGAEVAEYIRGLVCFLIASGDQGNPGGAHIGEWIFATIDRRPGC